MKITVKYIPLQTNYSFNKGKMVFGVTSWTE